MFPSHVETRFTGVKDDVLLDCLDQVDDALKADFLDRECDWTKRVWSGLARLGRLLQQHNAIATSADGPGAATELACATLMRRWSDLQAQYRNHLEQLAALKWEAYQASQVLPNHSASFGYTVTLPENAPIRQPPNLTALRCRGQQLLTALRRHREAEASLLLDSVNVDIGGGD
jgi:hypothetical protein